MKNREKYLYVHTIGCQMNVYDSERIISGLKAVGYVAVSTPEAADMIVVNTCAIREKAEQKVFSFLGRLRQLKRKKPGLIIGVGGCVAQQEGKKIMRRVPFVDAVFGTNAINRLPAIVERIESERRQIVDIELSGGIDEIDSYEKIEQNLKASRFVTIMQGCDNFCAYCVVPHVRGRECSRSPENIVGEITRLVELGVREVTLLGQNVNSYGKKEGLCSFPELLARVNAIDGLLRIRFTTSHPKDFSPELIDAFGALEKVCDHIHLPVQSGSNRILKRMNRKYDRERYLENVEKLRESCPEIAITSDFIVGFPGETDADFDDSLDLIRTVRFDGLFAFKYSDRPNAPAREFPDKLPDDVKNERLRLLLETQEEITAGKNRSLVGTVPEILVDGFSKKEAGGAFSAAEDETVQWTGRTNTNKIVNFHVGEGSESVSPGDMIWVRIEKAFTHSLSGRPAKNGATAKSAKGDNSHAA